MEHLEELTSIYLGTERYLEAMVIAKKAIRSHPNDPRAHTLIARIYLAQQNRLRACRKLEMILERWNDHQPARDLLEQLPAID